MTSDKAPTIELLGFIALLDAFHQEFGDEWCAEHLIGPMRRSLSRSFPANVVELNVEHTPEMIAYMRAQQELDGLLARIEDACRRRNPERGQVTQ